MTNPTTPAVFALLQKQKALEVFAEASSATTSGNLTVRGIIDGNIGFINIATTRPLDEVEERIIRVTTNRKPEEAVAALSEVIGVRKAATTFQAAALG